MKITDEYLRMKDVRFAKRFNGYCRIPRNRYLLFINKDLNASEMLVYLLLFDAIADWDNRHPEYGVFELDFDIFSRHIGCSNSTLRRIITVLLNKNLIRFLADKKYSIVGFKLRESISTEGFNFYSELCNETGLNETDRNLDEFKKNDAKNNTN